METLILTCADCKQTDEGSSFSLLHVGWKWLETRYKNKLVRIALCPACSPSFPRRWKDLLAKRIGTDPKNLDIEVRI